MQTDVSFNKRFHYWGIYTYIPIFNDIREVTECKLCEMTQNAIYKYNTKIRNISL